MIFSFIRVAKKIVSSCFLTKVPSVVYVQMRVSQMFIIVVSF